MAKKTPLFFYYFHLFFFYFYISQALMKWRGYEGLYHDNSHHLALAISRKDRTNRSVTHPNRPRLPRKRIFFFFSFFPFLFQSRATSSSPGGLGIPSRWHHELNAPVIERERKSFCVCRRERAIRSRQSFGHQPERRDVTYIYINLLLFLPSSI